MLFYPAALPLSRQTLTYTAGVIRRHRKQVGSPWRKLNPGRQALLVLAYLRKGRSRSAPPRLSSSRARQRAPMMGRRREASCARADQSQTDPSRVAPS
jgi:hypothetical protein